LKACIEFTARATSGSYKEVCVTRDPIVSLVALPNGLPSIGQTVIAVQYLGGGELSSSMPGENQSGVYR